MNQAGSARGSTPSSSCRGNRALTTTTTSVNAAACSTRTPRSRRSEGPHHRVPRRAQAEGGAQRRHWLASRAGTILVLAALRGRQTSSANRSPVRSTKFVRTALVVSTTKPNPRASPHLRGRPTRPHRAGVDRRRLDEPVVCSTRSTSSGGLARRPDSALLEVLDPRAEPHLPRTLPRARAGSVVGGVHRNREHNDRMPAPLLDRMEPIPISGYSEDEKLRIARDPLCRASTNATA